MPPRERPRPPRRRLVEPPEEVPDEAGEVSPPGSTSVTRRDSGEEGWLFRTLPAGGGATLGGGAGLESPILGLRGGASAPFAIVAPSSLLRAPFAASGAPVACSPASGTDAGRPVVGSDIGEIPSPGRADKRRLWHPASGTDGGTTSGALGPFAEIDSENKLFVVSFTGPRAKLEGGAGGDGEEDKVGDDRRGNPIRL